MGDYIISSHPKDQDEEDEVLSFCDIPIYIDASADNTFTTSSSEEEDFFEFFGEGFPSSRSQPDSFVFCGRFISYGEPSTSRKKVSRGTSRISSVKSCKWYKIMFGSMRLSTEMDLDDIKSRQRKHRKPKAVFKMYGNEERSHVKRSSSNGLMNLVRSFNCRGQCSTSIVKPKAMFKMYENEERSHVKISSSNGLMSLVRSFSCRGQCSTSIVSR